MSALIIDLEAARRDLRPQRKQWQPTSPDDLQLEALLAVLAHERSLPEQWRWSREHGAWVFRCECGDRIAYNPMEETWCDECGDGPFVDLCEEAHDAF